MLPTTLAVPFTPLNPMANPMATQTIAFGSGGQHIMTPGVAFAQSVNGLGPMSLGAAGGLSALGLGMGMGMSSNFGMTQAGYNLLPRGPPTMVPSIQVNMQDKTHCLPPPTNVHIY